MADESRNFALRIITPDRTVFKGEASMVEFNTTEGQIGVYKDHSAMTESINAYLHKITLQEGVRRAGLHSGFVEILQDSITFLAEVIEWPEEIDEKRAEAAKERAEKLIREHNPQTDMGRAEAALQRARARINVIH